MLNSKLYMCSICDTKPDQISHHKAHLETQKHIDKKELFEMKLSKKSQSELLDEYKIDDVKIIVDAKENVVFDSKKLNNIENTKEDLINIEILSKNMSDKYVISNKEALKDKIHDIHNYLRNHGAGYGMGALKVFNIIYGLKKIEENKLTEKIKLKKPECLFSHLLKLANENKDEKLAETIYGPVLDSISGSDVRDLLFYEIPKNMKSSTFTHLIKEIDTITKIEKSCNVLLSGKIYEYFIGRDDSAISELGAYFTDRHITDFIYKKINPTLDEDGSVKSMVDMFGGSGGFTTGYIDYLVKNNEDIKWKNGINKVYHFDMNEDVIKSAGLEFFCLTGELPNMKENLQYKNSFKDEFGDKKFHYVITNPPYGGDKSKQSDAQTKRNKIKEYIKEELKTLTDKKTIERRNIQLKAIENVEKQEKKDNDKKKVNVESSSHRIAKFAKNNKLAGNDKESVSLMLMMDLLEENGTCCGVLKEGVFFNSVYKELRKCLIENYNVSDIISISRDQFENTTTKTSIVIFKNTKEKTKKIKFSKMSVVKFENDVFEEIDGNIELVENKDDIKEVVEKVMVEVSVDTIKEKKYSLNGKDYENMAKEIYCPEGFELKKLSDICEINPNVDKNIKNPKYYIEIGNVENNHIVNYSEYSDNIANAKRTVQRGDILISTVRPKSSKCLVINDTIDVQNFMFSSAFAHLRPKKNIFSQYIYNYLLNDIDNFENKYCNGSSYPRFKPNILLNYQIPVPKDISKIEPLIKKLHDTYNELSKMQETIPEKEKAVQNKIQEICDNEECDEYKLGDLCDLNKKSIDKNFKNDNIYYVDIGSTENGIIREVNCIKLENSPSRAKRLVNINDIILGTVRPEQNHYTIIKNNYDGNLVVSTGYVVITPKNINTHLCYYQITSKNMINYYSSMAKGSGYPAVDVDTIRTTKIKVPKSKSTMKKLEKEFEEIEKEKEKQEETEKKYKDLMAEFNKIFEPKESQKEKPNVKQQEEQKSKTKEKVKKEDKKKIESSSESSTESEKDSSEESSSESEEETKKAKSINDKKIKKKVISESSSSESEKEKSKKKQKEKPKEELKTKSINDKKVKKLDKKKVEQSSDSSDSSSYKSSDSLSSESEDEKTKNKSKSKSKK
jgi:type I restriction-modification system DNA methylase subunit